MADLRTDYKDDLLDTSVNTQRKYRMVTNDDGTVSFVDETVYTQNGDTFGASEVNQIHAAVNLVNDSLNVRYNEADKTIEIKIGGEWIVWKSNVDKYSWNAFTTDKVWALSEPNEDTVTTSSDSIIFTSTANAGRCVNTTKIKSGSILHIKGRITPNSDGNLWLNMRDGYDATTSAWVQELIPNTSSAVTSGNSFTIDDIYTVNQDSYLSVGLAFSGKAEFTVMYAE